MTPKTMQAAVLVELNQPLVVTELELPETLNFGQVLVKIHYSGICGTQINEITGAKGEDKWLPHLLGHEGSGVVEAVGAGVKTVKPGDHVVLHWRPSAGIQAETPTYRWGDKTVNAGWITTFNNYAIVSENRVTPIPANFDMRIAPLFGCAVTTALGAVNYTAQVTIGQSVVIFGVGGVGLNLVQGCALVSANPIVAVDLHDTKLDMARQLGATHVLNATKTAELKAAILEVIGAKGADVIFETTGNPRVIEDAYNLTHADGKTILIGVPRKGENISIYSLPLHFNKVLTGTHGGDSQPDVEIPRYVRLVEAGKLALDNLITHEFTLEQINTAVEITRRGEAGRCIIKLS